MLLIIQARTSSKRLKNKVLHKLFGSKVIDHVIRRVKQSKNIKKIVVATSNDKSDNKLASYLKSKKILVYRGSLSNVAQRLLDTAKFYKKDYFVRVSADSPLIDKKVLDKAIKLFKNKSLNYDLITNVYPRSFPKGQSVEIIKTRILKKNINYFTKLDCEHVTRFFYRNAKKFKIKNFKYARKYKRIKLSIDTKKDYKKLLIRFNKNEFLNYSIGGI